MNIDFLELWQKYSKEITLIVITAITTFIFTKLLPTLFTYLKQAGAFLLALLTGRRKEYKFETRYLDWLINEHKYLTIIPSQVLNPDRLPKQPELEEVYIQLQLRHTIPDNPIDLPISELVKRGAKTVILGDPGSGKTTLLRYICLTYSRLAKTSFLFFRKRRSFKSRIDSSWSAIPILIYLNRLSQKDSNVLSVAESSLPESLQSIYPEGYFQKLLKNGKCIVLLDGLDEVSSLEGRNRIGQVLSSLSNASHKDNTWIVTSRIVGYKGQLHSSFLTAIVQSLTSLQVRRFIETWYSKKCENTGFPPDELQYQRDLHAQRANHLIDTLRSNQGLASLATNPMLVSLIALLHSVQIELPENRALLYRDCVELLADRWDLFRGIPSENQAQVATHQKISILKSIAWHMHSRIAKEIRQSEVEAIISPQLSKALEPPGAVSAGKIISNLEERSGLIITRGITESGDKVMAFSHLSFQEYLTATSLLSEAKSHANRILSTQLNDPWWREPILLYVAQINSPFDLIEQIYKDSFQEKPFDHLLLAASCLAEIQVDKTSELYKSVFNEIVLLYSSGGIENLRTELIKYDKYNALLRHMVKHLQNISDLQKNGMELLLRIKRGDDVDEGIISRFIQNYGELAEISDADLVLIESIRRRKNFSLARTLPLVFKHSGPIYPGWNWPNTESSSFVEPDEIALNEIDLADIAAKMPVLVPRIIGIIGSNSNLSSDWRKKTLMNLIDKHEAIRRGSELISMWNQDDHSFSSAGAGKAIESFLAHVERKEYSKAAAIYHKIEGGVGEEDTLYQDLSRLYGDTDRLLTKCFCIMLICRLIRPHNDYTPFLIDFILNNVKLLPHNKTLDSSNVLVDANSITSGALIRCLVYRALDKLPEPAKPTNEYVRALIDCHLSSQPEIAGLALSRLHRLNHIPAETVHSCLGMLDSSLTSEIWTSILVLSASEFQQDIVISKILPFLSYKELSLNGTAVSEIAAYSILRIASKQAAPDAEEDQEFRRT